MDAYKVLGLTEGATEEEIKTAYRALAQKYNPDNYEAGPLREEAEAKMTELNEAFDALMGAIRTGTPVNSRRTANAGEPEPDTGAALAPPWIAFNSARACSTAPLLIIWRMAR